MVAFIRKVQQISHIKYYIRENQHLSPWNIVWVFTAKDFWVFAINQIPAILNLTYLRQAWRLEDFRILEENLYNSYIRRKLCTGRQPKVKRVLARKAADWSKFLCIFVISG